MVRNLDKLSKDDLFLVLSEKVDQEAATAMKNNGICGSTLIDLNDTQLKELLPKSGPRMMVKRLIDSFQSAGPSQPKVKHSHYGCMHLLSVHNHATCVINFVPHEDWDWRPIPVLIQTNSQLILSRRVAESITTLLQDVLDS